MRLALSSTETVIGQNGQHAVLRIANLDRYLETPPPDNSKLETPGADFSALLNSILSMYGEPATRGLFRRWGMAFGNAGVQRRPSAALLKPMLALLPLQRRVHTLLDALVHEADIARGESLHTLVDDPDHFLIVFHDCLYCAGMHPSEPICYTFVGTIEAVLKWGTGREFAVREVQCAALSSAARGDEACVFEIAKQPLHV